MKKNIYFSRFLESIEEITTKIFETNQYRNNVLTDTEFANKRKSSWWWSFPRKSPVRIRNVKEASKCSSAYAASIRFPCCVFFLLQSILRRKTTKVNRWLVFNNGCWQRHLCRNVRFAASTLRKWSLFRTRLA